MYLLELNLDSTSIYITWPSKPPYLVGNEANNEIFKQNCIKTKPLLKFIQKKKKDISHKGYEHTYALFSCNNKILFLNETPSLRKINVKSAALSPVNLLITK